MAQQIQKLTDEQIQKLTEFQNGLNETIFNIGRTSVRERIVKEEMDSVKQLLESLQSQYDEINTNYSNYLEELEKIYPNGEVDLKDGTVTFESAE